MTFESHFASNVRWSFMDYYYKSLTNGHLEYEFCLKHSRWKFPIDFNDIRIVVFAHWIWIWIRDGNLFQQIYIKDDDLNLPTGNLGILQHEDTKKYGHAFVWCAASIMRSFSHLLQKVHDSRYSFVRQRHMTRHHISAISFWIVYILYTFIQRSRISLAAINSTLSKYSTHVSYGWPS